MKIKTRLTVFYTMTTSIILLVFSLFIYFTMQFIVFREIDKKLEFFADSIISSIDSLAIFNLIDSRLKNLQNEENISIEVISPEGNIIFRTSTSNKVKHDLTRLTTRRKVTFFNYSIETLQKNISIKDIKKHRHIFRVLYKKFFHDNKFIAWIQIAQPVDDVFEELRKLKKIIFTGIIIFLFIISASGYALASESLHPIQNIISAAEKINDQNLSERIPAPSSKDELSTLVSTLNKLFDRLENSFQTQKRFISDAAHELKTPLAILRSNIEAELQTKGTRKKISAKRLSQNIDTLARLSGLVDKLLLLSRLENGKIILNEKTFNLLELLSDVVESGKFLASEKKQKITLSLPEQKDIIIKGDRDLIYQAILNLISNAVKYTQNGGKIDVSLEIKDSNAIICITDNGIGMNEEDLKRAFERFYRADSSRKKDKETGFGLGLSISKWIAIIHGGTIELKSTPNKGTSAFMYLPLSL